MQPLRNIAMAFSGLAVIAIVVFIIGFVLSAGVPYHDGPNAGYVNPPGFRRWLENASFHMFCVTALMVLSAIAAWLGYGIARWTVRR